MASASFTQHSGDIIYFSIEFKLTRIWHSMHKESEHYESMKIFGVDQVLKLSYPPLKGSFEVDICRD